MLKIYNYHPEYKTLLGSSLADESPLEPGVFLIPAFATEKEPLRVVDESQINIFNEEIGEWTLLDRSYLIESAEEKVEEEISDTWEKLSLEEKTNIIRSTRSHLLKESDWTQSRDLPAAFSKRWAPYRQALRDVPSQSGFPENVIWPEKPE